MAARSYYSKSMSYFPAQSLIYLTNQLQPIFGLSCQRSSFISIQMQTSRDLSKRRDAVLGGQLEISFLVTQQQTHLPRKSRWKSISFLQLAVKWRTLVSLKNIPSRCYVSVTHFYACPISFDWHCNRVQRRDVPNNISTVVLTKELLELRAFSSRT